MGIHDRLCRVELAKHLEELQTALENDTSETQRMLHNLQVYQIELEIQNEELQEVRSELEALRNRYAEIYDFSPIGYMTLDKNGRVLEINLTGAAMLGKDRAALLDSSFRVFVTSGESSQFFKHLREAFRSRERVTAELRIMTPEGRLRDVRLESIAKWHGKEDPDTCLTAMIDVTQQKRAEEDMRRAYDRMEDMVRLRTAELANANEALRAKIAEHERIEEQLRQFAAVFDSTMESILVVSTDGRIIMVNRAFTRSTGYAAEEAQGESLELLCSGREDESFYRDLIKTLRDEGRWQGEIWIRCKHGGTFPVWASISAVRNGQGNIASYACVFSDITVIKQTEEQLSYLAHHDALTGLPNRLAFAARLDNALARAKRYSHRVALLYLDLDHFKPINDTLGHGYGDRLLQTVAERLRNCVRAEDTIARLGGDEFVVILDEINHPQNAARLAQKIAQSIEQPIRLNGRQVTISGSIGISIYPDNAVDGDNLLKTADAAMYAVKQHGRRHYRFYVNEQSASFHKP